MNGTSILLMAACVPSIALLIYIYNKDRNEKESFGLLLLLFGLGAASCIPAALIEVLLGNFNILPEGTIIHSLIENFFGIALVEEACKFLVLYLITNKNKNFDSLFDGVIYSVVVSLGFATLENILYVFESGLGTAALRAVTAVPGHMFFGVLMGCFYTMWHLGKSLSVVESNYVRMGYIDSIVIDNYSRTYKTQLFFAILAPVLAHGMYDFLASSSTGLSMILFFALLIALYVYCFAKVKHLSNRDNKEANIIASVLNQRYPYLNARISYAMRQQQMQYNPFNNRYYNPYSQQNDYSVQYRPQPQNNPVPQNGYGVQYNQAPQNNNNYTYR